MKEVKIYETEKEILEMLNTVELKNRKRHDKHLRSVDIDDCFILNDAGVPIFCNLILIETAYPEDEYYLWNDYEGDIFRIEDWKTKKRIMDYIIKYKTVYSIEKEEKGYMELYISMEERDDRLDFLNENDDVFVGNEYTVKVGD